MIGDLTKIIPSQTQTKVGTTAAVNNTGVLAKLSSELKLIDGIHPIRITSTQALVYQQKPTQLLEATTLSNQKLSLINTGEKITSTADISYLKIDPTNKQATLMTNSQSVALKIPVQLASKSLTLTVVDSTKAANNQPNTFLTTVTDGIDTLQLKTQQPLAAGHQINVFVDHKGQLQLIPNTPPSQPVANVESALKQSLPQQLNLTEMTQLFKQLQTLADPNSNINDKLKASLIQLVQNLPSLTSLTNATAIKESLQNSGLFLENSLSQTPADVSKDLKLGLLKLQAVIDEPSTTRIPAQFELVSKAIERITTLQLKNLVDQARSETANLPLQFEIPIRQGNSTSLIQFQVDREPEEKPSANTKEKRRWLVKLRFDFPETGKFEARMSLQQNKVSLIFVAENDSTKLRIDSHLSSIRTNLQAKDITVEKLDCFCAPLATIEKPNISQHLIDVRT